MAEEGGTNAFDAALSSVASGIEHLIEPEEHTLWHDITHEWLSFSAWVEWIGDKGVSRGFFTISFFVPLVVGAQILLPEFIPLVASWLFLGLPILAPIALFAWFWHSWIWYVQSYYIFTRVSPVLLEVKMPPDVHKSPRAMEQVLTSFWIRAGVTTEIDRNWYGGVLPYSSLEIASFGGEIHFYIWCRSAYRNVIEAAMYSQYPEVEIVEVPDYATAFEYDPEKHHCFATDYIYDPKGRGDKYPIKTYVNFELDKDPKEEHRVDPYASILEVLGALNKDEQAWIQIVIRGYHKQDWQKEVLKEVEKIRDSASQGISLIVGETGEEDDEKKIGFPRPTLVQREQMENMERNLSKLIFDCGLRGLYIAPRGKMRSAEYTAIRWIWRPFNNPNYMTQLRPRRAHNDFDYPWQDWGVGYDGVRWVLWTRRYFDMYRRRQFFHSPWQIVDPPIRMSTEVLATLWHPPSSSVVVPGLPRIPVAKAEAPHNLPV